ncbi:hypothetical protein JCM21714_1735 [Gracilibacillus boraciitolerans JCM 21714]|uniref:Uncharacterized protein n=1 Tax=Gracilibacillus boraciitolerans JCM 21714 TaxID=1298598 RepID=W4VIY9_9BACI|nr:hypothetical protein [Gracilibacillus boraciitolerans]GAE92724.1 hypothetical protein JCM21714_1735 [Gracilibacillus boraciitolerans JCM 21714]
MNMNTYPFIDYLLTALKLTLEDYQNYWHEVKDFRDKFSAHREIIFNEPVPNFEVAYKVALLYVAWLEKYLVLPSLELMLNEYHEELNEMIENFRLN